ncbi:AraC family transcriptional regulator [Paenibacillus mucilaginosus 3016]|uniref:AraC family transcriptional regulator n=1 Tax=Paenibacillus mucilaginosus 3016 TaxID=1116391 RepID=H6NMC3_9BACL|nr:response regulator [Paenibacillus mucilaginosus]AFC33285.1 AraC family transcriptional regulator [Paenibacillus mucilaginosus 3016]WFA21706.1 response regulator [Paenibacillus mucilaginosus]
MNILVVDDEPIIRDGIKRTIQSRFPDHTVHLAPSPEEAAGVLRSQPIQLVLTDILMPGMTGLELMNVSRGLHPNVKWVVISAHSEFAYAQEAVRLGARDYLLKPVGKDQLAELIGKISDELEQETQVSEEAELFKSSLKYLREAVFQRWASGLDIGRIDMLSVIDSHPQFHLVMVKMDSDRKVNLEHYIIENVLTELIEGSGHGFVASYDSQSLIGLVTLAEGGRIDSLIADLKSHLKTYLRVPFQVMHTGLLSDFEAIPAEVQRMRQASATQVYDHDTRGGDKAIEVALQYIKTHYQDDLSLEKVASVVFLNPVYFSQLFKQKTGQGFKEYVIHLRLEQAKQLLQNPTLKLADIAERIGYQDMRHFTQVFRKRFGVTPTEYRQGGGAESVR